MPELPRLATVIGFDYGTRNIGVAVGQTVSRSANPLDIVPCRDGKPDWKKIASILEEWQPDVLVVGQPLNMDGSESPMCEATEKFARQLEGRFSLPVSRVDERLSSFEAKQEASGRESYAENPVDDLAARVIVETWLNNQS